MIGSRFACWCCRKGTATVAHYAWLLHSLSLPRCETAAAFVEKKGRQYSDFALQSTFGDKFGINSRPQRCARSCTCAHHRSLGSEKEYEHKHF
jgi:hypothetical protein